jgi:hypothetical protein
VRKLRAGIREHRNSTRHELCWHHPALWGLLPEKTDPIPTVPDWPQFMEGDASSIGSHSTRSSRMPPARMSLMRNDECYLARPSFVRQFYR